MNEQKEFHFSVDQKVTIWLRTPAAVKAASEKEAKEILLERLEKGEDIDEFMDFFHSEYLFETEDPLTIEENYNESTFEVYEGYDNDPNKLIYSNGK